jgi:hypothetical protein
VIVAQTNLQLFRQLEVAGWSTPDRQRALAAYVLAAELHSGQYRASGKTFVAHLCGTASIVEAAGGTTDQTLAALLHAVYDQGDFGDGRATQAPRKRAEVRAAVGSDAETLVAQYSTWPWRTRLPALLDGGPDGFADWERAVAFVRLANEIEERVDGADGYAPEHAASVFPLVDVVRCARLLGFDALRAFAEAFAQDVADEDDALDVPAALQATVLASGAIAPRSTRTRHWVLGTGQQSTLRRAARRIPGARHVVTAWRRRPTPSSE